MTDNTTAVVTADVDDATNKMAIRALIPLLITFVLGTLCLQGFNLVFQQVGGGGGAPHQASRVATVPPHGGGIVCFIYGSLGDFISLRKLVTVGLITLLVGSLFGFFANYFLPANLWTVIIARVLQTAGEQVAGSAFLVVATKYLKTSLKVIFFGLYTAAYQLSASIGVFAAGLLSTISWQFLFLIPAVTILFLPILLKNLPDSNGSGDKIDAMGFVIFGVATAFLTLFFSYMSWWMLALAAVLFIGFGVYISKAENPFITPSFFKNKRWLMAISLIALFYFTNYVVSPFYNAIGGALYGMNASQVSTYLVWAFVCAAIVGTSSGVIVGKIGRQTAIITAACLLICGFAGAAFCVDKGFIWLTVCACVLYCGVGLLYSPVVDTVLGTLTKDESGRGVGLNDLVMNVSPSIGIAIFGSLLATVPAEGTSIVGTAGAAAGYSNLLLIAAGVILLGLIVYLVFRKYIYGTK